MEKLVNTLLSFRRIILFALPERESCNGVMKHLTWATNDGEHFNCHVNDIFNSNRLILTV